MPSQSIIENTDTWHIKSIGNGWAYEIIHRPTGDSLWIQDDDATQFRDDYEAMQEAYSNPASIWHKQTWNACLTSLMFSVWP